MEVFESMTTKNESKLVIRAQRDDESSTEVTDTVEIFREKKRKPFVFDAVDRESSHDGDEESSSS